MNFNTIISAWKRRHHLAPRSIDSIVMRQMWLDVTVATTRVFFEDSPIIGAYKTDCRTLLAIGMILSII